MRIVVAGGYPPHYTRHFHSRLREVYGDAIRFIYILAPRGAFDSPYHDGNLPYGSRVLSNTDSWRSLWRELNESEADVLFCAGLYPVSLWSALVWAARSKKACIYWSDTNIADVLKSGGLSALRRKCIAKVINRMVTYFACIGTRNREFFLWALGNHARSKLCWIPYPHSTRQIEVPDRCDGQFGILYLGRLAPLKCVDHLLKAYRLLPEKIRHVSSLKVVGDGPDRPRLERLVDQLGLRRNVTFTGIARSAETGKLFAAADVFVLPSMIEPWGLVVNEALDAGIPVICPHWVGAAADLVQDELTGFVTVDNSPECLAAALKRAWDRRNDLPGMGRLGQQVVRNGGWNVDGAVESFCSLIDSIRQQSPNRMSRYTANL